MNGVPLNTLKLTKILNSLITKKSWKKFDDLAQIIKEKDDIINILVQKARTLEEKVNTENETINENDDSEIEMNKTFF